MIDYRTEDFIIEENKSFTIRESVKRLFDYENAFSVSQKDKEASFKFAFEMTYEGKGSQRSYRSGGDKIRSVSEKFINIFQGKMGEYAIYRYMLSKNIKAQEPDTNVEGKGEWDSYDIKIEDPEKYISVKTTKRKGQLLLLEAKDWNAKGEYKPNKNNIGKVAKYDYSVLVRFDPDSMKIMEPFKKYDYEKTSIATIKKVLNKNIVKADWRYDIAGFIFESELIKMIEEDRKIPKGAKLNGGTRIDADNYYFPAGRMHKMYEIFKIDYNDKEEKLTRKCPNCGSMLIRRKNSQSGIEFWGCSKFGSEKKCKYTENLE